ncbi:MAG: hypothetical protein HRT41_11205 [Campylobacteraceae bacterium]|nr:hypothetical protein [Campylobacteraceae bacterium]
MKKIYFLCVIMFIPFYLFANAEDTKRVLFIDSYSEEYEWSAGIKRGIKTSKNNSSLRIELKIFHMNTKINPSESFKKEAALKAKQVIENFKPDVVIACDDNAAKYLIVPYYNNSTLPFVFCGINGSAKEYNFSRNNVTGMIEVEFIEGLVNIIQKYAKGNTLGYLGADVISDKKEFLAHQKFEKNIEALFVSNVEDWKKKYLYFQKNVDILILSSFSPYTFKKEVREELATFVKKNTLIPSIAGISQVSGFTLLTFAKKPEEQGEWAMKTAIRILKGEKTKDIAYVKNKIAKMYINAALMKELNIHFPFELLENANIVH